MRNTLKFWLATLAMAVILAVIFCYAGFSFCNDIKIIDSPKKKPDTAVVLLCDLIAYTLENEVVRQEPPINLEQQAILLKNLVDLNQCTRRIETKLIGTSYKIEVLCRCCTCYLGCCWCTPQQGPPPPDSTSPEEVDSTSFFREQLIIVTEPDSLITQINAFFENSEGTPILEAADFPIQVGEMNLSGIRFTFSEIDFNGEANLRITALVNGNEEQFEVFLKGNLEDGVWTPGGEQ